MLERRGANIRAPEDLSLLLGKQRGKLEGRCDQVPVLGFNCGKYDLNLIKEHFAELLADTTTIVQVGKKANKTMLMKTDGFRFLDIFNYLAPGTLYDKWVKAYGCALEKSRLPYEWFDSSEHLNYPGLPDYTAWYSRLKGEFVLKLSEWKACKQLFKNKGMRTFAEWLRYYNDLDVVPGLDALRKMGAFYAEKGIDILKDAVSLPGVRMHYLFHGTIKREAELFSPCKEAYDMLKGAVVGGQSLVFNGTLRPARQKSVRTVSGSQNLARESLATTPTRSICRRCCVTCRVGKKKSCITTARRRRRE